MRESKENELREVNALHQQQLRQITDKRDTLRQQHEAFQSQQKNLIDAQQEEIKQLSAELVRAQNSHDLHVSLQPKKTPSTCHVDSIKPDVSSRSEKQLSHSSKDKEINLQVDKANLNINDGHEKKINSLLNTSGKRYWWRVCICSC